MELGMHASYRTMAVAERFRALYNQCPRNGVQGKDQQRRHYKMAVSLYCPLGTNKPNQIETRRHGQKPTKDQGRCNVENFYSSMLAKGGGQRLSILYNTWHLMRTERRIADVGHHVRPHKHGRVGIPNLRLHAHVAGDVTVLLGGTRPADLVCVEKLVT